MTNLEIETLKKRINDLEEFLNSTSFYRNGIFDWIAECVALFSEFEMNNEVISGFMKTFDCNDNFALSIGPFKYSNKNRAYVLFNSFGTKNLEKDYYIRIAFVSARAILRKEHARKKIVPYFLVELLSESIKYSNIHSSLELIEKNYSERSADSLLKNSIVLLESILNLEETLREEKLALKLEKLMGNKKLREKFGASRDIIKALNNSRVVRNIEVSHKDLPLEYDIPFLVVSGFAYLVILFLEIVISTGDLIEIKST